MVAAGCRAAGAAEPQFSPAPAAALARSRLVRAAEPQPEQCELEADVRMHLAARLEATLRRVSENVLVLRGERLVVLTDGLDEYDPHTGPRSAPCRDFILAEV